MIEYKELQKILPQAYPFVLIDRVEEFKSGESLVAVKNITANEWIFEDRNDEVFYYPETLLIEAAAQAALVLYKKTNIQKHNQILIFQLTKVEFKSRALIQIGNLLRLEVFATKMWEKVGIMDIEIYLNGSIIGKTKIFYKGKDETQ